MISVRLKDPLRQSLQTAFKDFLFYFSYFCPFSVVQFFQLKFPSKEEV